MVLGICGIVENSERKRWLVICVFLRDILELFLLLKNVDLENHVQVWVVLAHLDLADHPYPNVLIAVAFRDLHAIGLRLGLRGSRKLLYDDTKFDVFSDVLTVLFRDLKF